jgi:hypothetical protein
MRYALAITLGRVPLWSWSLISSRAVSVSFEGIATARKPATARSGASSMKRAVAGNYHTTGIVFYSQNKGENAYDLTE